MRKIVVNGKTWEWRVGRSNVVLKLDKQKHIVKFEEIVYHRCGFNERAAHEYVERGQRKRYFHITPADIAYYLKYAL